MSLNIENLRCSKYVPKQPDIDPLELKKINLGVAFFEGMKKYHNNVLQRKEFIAGLSILEIENNTTRCEHLLSIVLAIDAEFPSAFEYIADTGEIDTFGEVLTRSIRTALKLQEKGFTKNDVISTCSHNHKNNVVPIIASLFIGVKIANFDPNLSHLDTIHLLKLVEPKVIFVSFEALPFMEKCLKESNVKSELVVFGYSEKYSQFSEYLTPHPKENDFKPVEIDDSKETAIIFFSSGTTGFPKGICISHYSLLTQNRTAGDHLTGNSSGQSVCLLYTTYYWISAVLFLIKCVTHGDARVMCSKFDPLETWKIIEKYKVTSIFLAPYHAVEFLAHRIKEADTSSLKYFCTGSCHVTKELMDSLNEALPNTTVVQGYGQTEVAGFMTMFNSLSAEDIEMQRRKPQSCGKINKKLVWKIVDPLTEEKLGPNQRGELRVKSDFLMNGYYKMDTSSAYDSEGYFKTGDIVYYDDDQCFYVVDRVKEIFKYRGWHILPAIVEEVIMSHPAVKEAAVIGVPHEVDGEHPMGIVVLRDGHEDVTPDDIERYVEERVLDSQRLRAGVKIVKNMIRTTTQKVNRNAMKKMVLGGLI